MFHSIADIDELLSKPERLSYKQVRAILDHTGKFEDSVRSELFHAALDIYLVRPEKQVFLKPYIALFFDN